MQPITNRYGKLIPQNTTDDLRKRELFPVVYHGNGALKSLPLEDQTTIPTPAGDLPAELVTFHANGALNRVFPLNGKLCGYWSEADEMNLSKLVTLNTPIGTIVARIISISFYDNETIRSITLWPGEIVVVNTPAGPFEARIGMSFAPDGTVESLEPAKPTPVQTIVGEVMAYDPDAVGICGDDNSLVLDKSGAIIRVKTTLTCFSAVSNNGITTEYAPTYRDSYCGDGVQEIEPMIAEFTSDTISISGSYKIPAVHIPLAENTISAKPYLPMLSHRIGIMSCSL